MTDPVVQDTREHHDKLAKFNRAVEAMVPVVMKDYTFFESFLMDEYPDIYNKWSDSQLKVAHGWFSIGASMSIDFNSGTDMFNKWLEYVNTEAVRRVEG